MGVWGRRERDRAEFDEFVDAVEEPLRHALTATYGPVDGRAATVDALSWAWEHWDRIGEIQNRIGYLYRVGQTAVRGYAQRLLPVDRTRDLVSRQPEVTPELMPILASLSLQQRTVVVLVHAYGWSQADVASLLDISSSTVAEHLRRALERLRSNLEVR